MPRQQYSSDVSPEGFAAVRVLLESARKKTRPRKHDVYDVFCAVLYFLDRGQSWRSLPPDLPPWRTVHEYFTQWTQPAGSGPTLLERALEQAGQQAALERLRHLLALR